MMFDVISLGFVAAIIYFAIAILRHYASAMLFMLFIICRCHTFTLLPPVVYAFAMPPLSMMPRHVDI